MAVVLNRFVGGLVSLFDRIWAYRSWRYVAYALLFIIAVTEPMYPMWGKGLHKQLGDIFFIAVAIHVIGNRAWFTHLNAGKYTIKRRIHTVLNVVLILAVLATAGFVYVKPPMIGLSVSKHEMEIYHQIAGYIFVAALCGHIGWHGNVIATFCKKHLASLEGYRVKRTIRVILFLFSIVGIFGIVTMPWLDIFNSVVTGQPVYDSGSLVSTTIEYFGMGILLAMIGYVIERRVK